jgi:GGDEF domain-containing protein
LRSIDTITRYGGDEFIALLVNVSNAEEGKLIGQKNACRRRATHRNGNRTDAHQLQHRHRDLSGSW